MTAKHLAPNTATELSTLKRRVSDLEKMLDRVRRDNTMIPATVYDTPYASFTGADVTVPNETLTALGGMTDPLKRDPTGHIHTGEGSFVFIVPGFYEIGGTVEFNDGASPGFRTLAVTYGGEDEMLITRVGRAPAAGTALTGSRIISVDSISVFRWQLAVAHNANTDLLVRCRSFWARLVTTTR